MTSEERGPAVGDAWLAVWLSTWGALFVLQGTCTDVGRNFGGGGAAVLQGGCKAVNLEEHCRTCGQTQKGRPDPEGPITSSRGFFSFSLRENGSQG